MAIYTLRSFETTGVIRTSFVGAVPVIPAATGGRVRTMVMLHAAARNDLIISDFTLGGQSATHLHSVFNNTNSDHTASLAFWDEAAITAAGVDPQINYTATTNRTNDGWTYAVYESDRALRYLDNAQIAISSSTGQTTDFISGLSATGVELAFATMAYGNDRTFTYSSGWTDAGQFVSGTNSYTGGFAYASGVSNANVNLSVTINNPNTFDRTIAVVVTDETPATTEPDPRTDYTVIMS